MKVEFRDSRDLIGGYAETVIRHPRSLPYPVGQPLYLFEDDGETITTHRSDAKKSTTELLDVAKKSLKALATRYIEEGKIEEAQSVLMSIRWKL